ncbi:glycoside hydrolase family 6 protein [Streptomyces milbemycinicus]|uniref:glycoside hydrolase family 6 protein n=1 Tax=Streptomyces milbemycinicus TaxID=476552 RepID=UPI0033D3AC35
MSERTPGKAGARGRLGFWQRLRLQVLLLGLIGLPRWLGLGALPRALTRQGRREGREGRERRPGRRSPLRTRRGIVQLLALALMAEVATAATTLHPPVGWAGDESAFPLPKPYFPVTTRFYTDPDNPAAQWVRGNPHDRRATVIRKRIADQPQAAWFTDTDQGRVEAQVRQVVRDARARGRLPVLVAYAIPHRDCGKHSSGGMADPSGYRNWISGFARGIGASRAIVILEPDALAHLTCLKRRQQTERYAELSYAGRTLRRQAAQARIYYDAGNSGWLPSSVMAERLERAGIDRYGDGIALNVSNFNATRDEVRYGLSVLRELRLPRLGAVIDTSRNGAGPTHDHRFCDPPGRKLGTPPTARTGIPGIDAYLWVKQPGQADGCAATAGLFVPGYAFRLTR